ncbi:hypothetical protein SAMN04487895_10878 [Paenibacillus sophorae]|uniref:Uncharacterized protein n=1 Tax=Paenibacillus sophorae TaxID=1333845 RepID=A0A1H8Q5E6_9BACL|nr:hypothetical protein SAMN04487895_10878 [Paenibacillus sophorae]
MGAPLKSLANVLTLPNIISSAVRGSHFGISVFSKRLGVNFKGFDKRSQSKAGTVRVMWTVPAHIHLLSSLRGVERTEFFHHFNRFGIPFPASGLKPADDGAAIFFL